MLAGDAVPRKSRVFCETVSSVTGEFAMRANFVSNRLRWQGIVTVAIPCAIVCWAASCGIAEEETKAKEAPAVKVEVSPSVSQAGLAAKLAMEGEKRRSPVLLLAAAEILGNLKEGEAKSDVAQEKPENPQATDKQAIELNLRDLTDKAVEYAKNDPKLSALVESRVEQLSTRGLVYSQGAGLPSFKTPLGTFKLVDSGVLGRGDVKRLTNVRFEGGEPAVVLVIGDGDGDLDLWVHDENTGGLIGDDTDDTSECIVAWTPRYTGPFTIRIANVGAFAERYVVVVNW
jgi:hypothetical protein